MSTFAALGTNIMSVGTSWMVYWLTNDAGSRLTNDVGQLIIL